MGNVSFSSPRNLIAAPPHKVFAFLSDLRNMEKLMPEQVINWKSDGLSCSFDIRGMAHIHLVLGELIADRLVTIDSGADNPIDIQLLFELSESSGNECNGMVTLNAELSMMLQMLASNPLQNLVNIMAEKLKGEFN